MSVFFTDTDCEMNYQDAEALNIRIIEMPYTLKGKEHAYDMGKTFDAKEFFNQMREGEVVTTSALNSQNYIDYFEPVLASGEDILYVHFSSNLSATFNYMNTALDILKEKYPDRKVTVFDTYNISVGGGIQAIEAAKLHNSGATDEEVVEFLKTFSQRVAIYFYVDSLKYLKRGGRISAASAVMGSLLNIKPILEVSKEGKIEKLCTVMGTKKALDFLYDKFLKEYSGETKYCTYVLDADNEEGAKQLIDRLNKSGKSINLKRISVGPVIGAHAGPGTIGLVFIKA